MCIEYLKQFVDGLFRLRYGLENVNYKRILSV